MVVPAVELRYMVDFRVDLARNKFLVSKELLPHYGPFRSEQFCLVIHD